MRMSSSLSSRFGPSVRYGRGPAPGRGFPCVAGQVGRAEPVFDAEPCCGRLAASGGEVLALRPAVHQLRGEESDLLSETFVGHEMKVRAALRPIKGQRRARFTLVGGENPPVVWFQCKGCRWRR